MVGGAGRSGITFTTAKFALGDTIANPVAGHSNSPGLIIPT